MNDTKPGQAEALGRQYATGWLRQEQLCSDIAKDGRFALSCCEQRWQCDSAT